MAASAAMRWIAIIALVLGAADVAAARSRCGSSAHRGEAVANRAVAASVAVVAANGLAEVATKETRDGFGGGFAVRESDNFALKWTDAPVDEATAQRWLETLEQSWRYYTDVIGHAEAAETSRFRVNVYVHGVDDTPDIDWIGAYVSYDDDGYPYVVVADALVGDPDSRVPAGLLAHELYHVVQYGTGSFEDVATDWFWEATAEWAAQQATPDDPDVWDAIGAYATAPELPLWFFGDVLDDGVEGLHPYGASIFFRHLADRFGADLIRDTWEMGAPAADPLAQLASLSPAPLDVELAIEFAARNAYWTYDRRAEILEAVDAYAGERHFPSIAAGAVVSIGSIGGFGWTRVDLGDLDGPATIAVDAPGGAGAVVAPDGDVARLSGDGQTITVDLEGDSAVLMLAAGPAGVDAEVSVQPAPIAAGCHTSGSGGALWPLALVLAGSLLRRRRREGRAARRSHQQ